MTSNTASPSSSGPDDWGAETLRNFDPGADPAPDVHFAMRVTTVVVLAIAVLGIAVGLVL